jgi:hypothetical protein
MATLLLMGVGMNNWLAYLWVLLGMAAIVQSIDWSVKFIRERKRRKQEERELALHELLSEGDGSSIDDLPEIN